MRPIHIKATFFLVFMLIAYSVSAQSDAAKYENAIYKESDVPSYDLPALLESFDGESIQSVDQWESSRRPEIIKFFEEQIFGRIPTPQDPIQKKYRVVSEDPDHLEGLCTRRDILITLSNSLGTMEMPMVLFIPNQRVGPVPAIYWVNLLDYKKGKFELEGPQSFGKTKNGAPLKQLMLRGIALISMDAEALGSRDKSREEVLDGGIIDLHFAPGQKNTRKDEWGLISVWAYSVISGMDYIVTDGDIHPDQIAAMGSSIGGKVAIWAAGLDERIGMVLSSSSGHGGDALWKRQVGETLDNMLEWLPRWLGRNAINYKNNIESLPVDQHMLLASLAPRPLYVSTAVHDLWADQKGQWLGTYHAGPAYALYKAQVAFTSEGQPTINEPIVRSQIGYHVRSGFHGLKLYDWERYMEFIEYHFLQIPVRSVHEVYYPNGIMVDHYPNKN